MKRLSILLTLLVGLLAAIIPVAAQSAEWESATLIYESQAVDQPTLVADASGALHLVWTGVTRNEHAEAQQSLLYAQFTPDGWSTPNDVIVMEDVSVRQPVAAVDNDGILHVIWGGSGLNYSYVPTWEAGSAANWSEPIKIGTGDIINSPTALRIDANGVLHVLVALVGEGETYYIQSPDSGKTWYAPQRISSSPEGTASDTTAIAIASDGTLHAVWSRVETPIAYPPLGVYYAYSADSGQTWTIEQPVADADYGEPFIIVDANDNVHIAYNGRVGVGGKYHRVLLAGETEWSQAVPLAAPETNGLNGPPELVADAEGDVHFIAGGDRSVYFATWRDGRWGSILNLRDTLIGSLAETERTTMKLVAGNQLHAVFENNKRQLWHTWRVLDVPPIALQVYGDLEAEEVAIETARAEVVAVDNPFLVEPSLLPDPTPTTPADPNQSLVSAIVAALAVLLLAVGVQLVRHRL